MRFKNYRNKYNNQNRIYSEDDVFDMTLGSIFDNENDLLAQNREIGIPTVEELQNSPNAVWIEAYTRDDGTEVRGHWRSLPDEGRMTGGANNITQNKQEKTLSTIETEQQNPKLYPEEVAGIKRGKLLSFEEAIGEDINPEYYSDDKGYQNNCQSCVIAFEARRRGYKVQAEKQTGEGKIGELLLHPLNAWLDNETKEPCEGKTIEAKNGEECFNLINKEVKQGERYVLIFFNFLKQDDIFLDEGHIVNLDRNDDGKLRLYDPQSNGIREDDEIIGNFNALIDFTGRLPKPLILRVDNKEFNPYYIDEVVRKPD